MPKIHDDRSLRDCLAKLTVTEQRHLAGRFVNRTADLARDQVLRDAIEAAMDPDTSDTARAAAYKNARSVAVKTYTSCGRDADWLAQAEHFVAAACSAALTPDDALTEAANLAWKTAMQARMARNCAMIEAESIDEGGEIQAQYRLTEEFLAD